MRKRGGRGNGVPLGTFVCSESGESAAHNVSPHPDV